MPRGGKRLTSFKPGQSGNPRGRPRNWAPVPQDGFADAKRINVDITPAGASSGERRQWPSAAFLAPLRRPLGDLSQNGAASASFPLASFP